MSLTSWLAERRIRAIARRERDARDELLVEFLVDDVAGPWVTGADITEAARRLDP